MRLAGLSACSACGRALPPQARQCPKCSAATGVPWNPAGEALDRWLDGLRLLGIAVGTAASFGGVLMLISGDGPGPLLVVYGVLLAAFHTLLPLAPLAWHLSEGLWGLGGLATLIALRAEPVVAAVAAFPSFAVWVLLLWLRPRLLPHLQGRLPAVDLAAVPARFSPGSCERCGDRSSDIVAPVLVVSFIFMSTRRLLGPRNLCATHARLVALPAALLTLVLGWWGIPWGVLWTPGAIYQDLAHGGVRLSPAEAEEHVAALQRSPFRTGLFAVLGAVAALFLAAALWLSR